MNKLLIGGLAVVTLALTGCATAVEPEPTVTQSATPAPQAVTPEPQSSALSEDAMFLMMMEAVDTPGYFLEGELLETLQDQAKSTCDFIDQGMTADDITLALITTVNGSDSTEDVKNAFMAATIASVYSYCPEYDNFWD